MLQNELHTLHVIVSGFEMANEIKVTSDRLFFVVNHQIFTSIDFYYMF